MMRNVGRGDGDGHEERRPANRPDGHPPLPNDGVPAAPHFEDTDFKPTSPRRNLVLPDPYKNPEEDSSDDEPPMNRRRLTAPPDPSPEKMSRNPGTPDPDEPCSSKNMYGERNQGANSSGPRGSPAGEAEEQEIQGMEAAESAAVAALVAGPTRGLGAGLRNEGEIRRLKENGRVIQPPKLTKREWAAEYFSTNRRASQQPREPSPAPSPSPPPAPEDPEARRAREEEEERMVRENFDEEGNVREEALVFHAVPEERLSSEEVEHRQEEQDEVVPRGGSDGEEEARQEAPEEDEDVQEEIESISEYDDIPDVRTGERSPGSSSNNSENEQEEAHNQIIEREEPVESEPEEDPIPAPASDEAEISDEYGFEDMSGLAHHPNYASFSEETDGEKEEEKEEEKKEEKEEQNNKEQEQAKEEPQQPTSSQQPAAPRRGRPKKSATQSKPSEGATTVAPPRGRPLRKRAKSPSPSTSRSRSSTRRLPRRPPNVAAKKPKTKEDSAPVTSPSISPVGRKRGRQPHNAPEAPDAPSPLPGTAPVGKRGPHQPIKSELSGKYWGQLDVSTEGGRARRVRKPVIQKKSTKKPAKNSKRGRKPGKKMAQAPAPVVSSVSAALLHNPPPLQLSRLCAGCQNKPAQAIPVTETGDVVGNDGGKANFFIVEKILGHKRTEKGHFYHIKWLGYDASHNTWEPTSSIIEAASDSGLLFLQEQYDKLAKITTPAEEWTVLPSALRAKQENMASPEAKSPATKENPSEKSQSTGPRTRSESSTAATGSPAKKATVTPTKKTPKTAGKSPKKAPVAVSGPETLKKYALRTREGH